MRSDAWEPAYAEFVAARQTHLRRIAYAIVGDWDRADELLHDALTRLYVVWPRMQRDGTEEAFVRRVILRARVGPHPAAPAEPFDQSPLFTALLTLPLRQRKVAVLHLWLGLSLEQTADELGLTTLAVRHQAERALASLEALKAGEAR